MDQMGEISVGDFREAMAVSPFLVFTQFAAASFAAQQDSALRLQMES